MKDTFYKAKRSIQFREADQMAHYLPVSVAEVHPDQVGGRFCEIFPGCPELSGRTVVEPPSEHPSMSQLIEC